MLRLYVKDNISGRVHEYGTNKHDALILQNDGSLHYENLQCCAGTMFPEEGYSFCNEDGTIPKWDEKYGSEPYIDIGGEYYNKPATNADRIRSMSDDELNDLFYEIYNAGVEDASSYEWGQRTNSFEWTMDWLQMPTETQKEG